MKKLCLLLVLCLSLLALLGCSEGKDEGSELSSVILPSGAVLEDGNVKVIYPDGFVLELGAIGELPWIYTLLKESGGYSVVAAADANGNALSAALFPSTEESLARFGKEIVFSRQLALSPSGGSLDNYYVIGSGPNSFVANGNVIVRTYEAYVPGSDEHESFAFGIVGDNVAVRTYEFNYSNPNGNFTVSVGNLMGSLSYQGKSYGVVDDKLIPLLISQCVTLSVPAAHDGQTVVALGDRAFAGYSSLEVLEIPASVTSLGNDLFSGCSAIKTIRFQGSEEQWNTVQKGDNWNSSLEIAVEFTE